MKLSDRRYESWEYEQSVEFPALERASARLTLSPPAARFLQWLARAILRIVSLGMLGRD